MTEVTAAAAGRGAVGQAGDLPRALDQLLRDSGKHLLTGPAHEADLAGLEQALGTPLPPAYRALLSRIGSGILYDRHELFGPHSLQLHDIEFVPSLLGVQKQLGMALSPGLLPFHRGGGIVHVLDVRAGVVEPVPVRTLDGSASHGDLGAFLAAVILPAAG